MRNFVQPARVAFAVSTIASGLIQIFSGSVSKMLFPLPGVIPLMAVYGLGALFVGAGLGMLRKLSGMAGMVWGVLLLVMVLILHLPLIITDPYVPGPWTAAGVLLIFSAASFKLSARVSWMFPRIFMAVAFFIFGTQHLVYGDYIVTLVPAWIPLPVVWLYLVRIGFIGAWVSLLLNRKVRVAMVLAGMMFLSWVVLVHVPGTVADVASDAEWTGLFVAMGVGSACFVMAKASSGQIQPAK